MSAFRQLELRAPKIPSPTCPAIDALIKEIDIAAKTLSDLTGRRGEFEILRGDNDALREVGKYWRQAAEDLSDQVDELEARCADLEKHVAERQAA